MRELLIGKPLRDVRLTMVQEIMPLTDEDIIEKQNKDDKVEKFRQKILKFEGQQHFPIGKDGTLCYKERKVIPNDLELKGRILKEAHCTPYTAHPSNTKIYRDLEGQFWWDGIKRDVADFVAKCSICQLSGDWESHFPLIEFDYNNSFQATIQMAPYEVLYGRKCKSSLYWDEVGEGKMLAP
ncbi:uncharacterized protein LOC121244219 [Juglans microcarpa x Juglans regia]|uniref:uncharacterized protein LOC121244219 n=1 Tax=Juglans microcarpa x Juglans regia TaxID=2249226 RepID=UPI001B7E1D5A|nr:uncharacterized protein LOC121244219 [Juglans microcarpa x Juglans regia]